MERQAFDLEFERPLVELVEKIHTLRQDKNGRENVSQIQEITEILQTRMQEIYAQLNIRQTVQVARHQKRPQFTDYTRLLFDHFLELRDDQISGNERTLLGGIATFYGQTVIVLGHQKGLGARKQHTCHPGIPRSEEYHKAYRLLQMAAKGSFPVFCLINTPGVFPGLEDGEPGQVEIIASLMARLPAPSIAVVIGEGGSGGVPGVADRLLMLEHSVYTVSAPDVAASLFRGDYACAFPSRSMHISAGEVLAMQIIDGLVPEPVGGAHRNPVLTACNLQAVLKAHLVDLARYSSATLMQMRYQKFRTIGRFEQER